ncbi:class I SAM-dependent methyltransferase [Pseudoalteromonas xiamenensis]
MEKITTLQTASTNVSGLLKVYRHLVHKAFSNLKYGKLVINEAGTRYEFGKCNAVDVVIDVTDPRMYKSFALGGSVGAAEAYIAGYWNTNRLTDLIELFVKNQCVLDEFEKQFSWLTAILNKVKHRLNRNTKAQSKKNIAAHYDLGNDLYTAFLSEEMLYSSAIFSHPTESLEEAQQNKLRAICERLDLKEGETLVEIGTGWGALALYAAENYGVYVTTTTISEEQFSYVKEKVAEKNLEHKITLLKKDYRELEGKFDKLVSIEMIEAVGHEYLAGFFTKCNALLKENGLMLIQAITIADQRYDHYLKNSDFIQQYIFPGGCLPSVEQMTKHIRESTNLVVHALHDIGLHYAHTLKHWHERFVNAWPNLDRTKFDESFYRLWTFYFCYCEGAFKQRATSAVHLVARKPSARTSDCLNALSY